MAQHYANMAEIAYRCDEHGRIDDPVECDVRFHNGHCPECDSPLAAEIA